jgi:hypothetical protein
VRAARRLLREAVELGTPDVIAVAIQQTLRMLIEAGSLRSAVSLLERHLHVVPSWARTSLLENLLVFPKAETHILRLLGPPPRSGAPAALRTRFGATVEEADRRLDADMSWDHPFSIIYSYLLTRGSSLLATRIRDASNAVEARRVQRAMYRYELLGAGAELVALPIGQHVVSGSGASGGQALTMREVQATNAAIHHRLLRATASADPRELTSVDFLLAAQDIDERFVLQVCQKAVGMDDEIVKGVRGEIAARVAWRDAAVRAGALLPEGV